MRLTLRILSLLLIFAAVACLTAWLVIVHVHAANPGAMEPEVRLVGAAGGVFAGMLAVLIAGIAMFWPRGESQNGKS